MDLTTGFFAVGLPFILLLALGMPVAFAFLFIMMTASIMLMGSEVGPYMTISSFFNSIGVFTLAPVPFFVLMGEVLLKSGLASQSLDALSKLLGKLPARLAIVCMVGGSLFGLLTGSTMASTAVLGSTLIPEMQRRGYSKQMSFGPILASGGLAMIIPPSSLAIIYGTIAEVPIGPLLIAGLIPGFLMAFNYTLNILLRVKLWPEHAPPYDPEPVPAREKLRLLVVDLLPLSVIVFLVTGIFVLGIATPTEAAALGAFGTVIVAAAYRRLTFKVLAESIAGTVAITTMVLFIIGGSEIFSRLLSYSGITTELINLMLGLDLPPLGFLLIMVLIILILGMFIESVPIIMVTTPIFVPLAKHLGFDQIWLGVILLIALQVGLTTPPFGMLLFVMKGIAPEGTAMVDLWKSVVPFILCDLITIGLIIAFPSIALWLPGLIMGR